MHINTHNRLPCGAGHVQRRIIGKAKIIPEKDKDRGGGGALCAHARTLSRFSEG
ncbi:hypothetical protein Abci_003_083 [Acetobacter cibinongensis]|uniref:Uncharacterized protein n=1 Tax=Acetobacter cibinongensis TaxID=146475 RepID=A0A0D6N0T3_9PROT|nr:hypothetical protein Abci_003_083 [Acetobacter cibinongensis]